MLVYLGVEINLFELNRYFKHLEKVDGYEERLRGILFKNSFEE
jgi:hypothetical protein